MGLTIFNLDDKEDQTLYLDIISNLDLVNPYLSLDFFMIFSEGLKNCICFYYENEDNVILMPGYLRSVNNATEFTDFSSPYGYSGPIFKDQAAKDELSSFWTLVDDWYLKNNIVSEFIRFSLNDNSDFYTGEKVNTLSNIKGCIVDEEAQWKNFDRKVRKNVNKAISENLDMQISSGDRVSEGQIKTFHDIYIQTMERTKANAKFFYTLDQFKTFAENNPNLCAFALVLDNGKCISAEMLLISQDSVYSFLGGTDENFFQKRPNDFLKYHVINWARERKISYFILGGGYGADDGIFKYKRAFFPNDVVTFQTGRKVINIPMYETLSNTNLGLLDAEERDEIVKRFFPLYRFKN